MHRRKPDLIVPIRDRRQHKRYITLRNARNVTLVLVVVFIGITIRSEMPRRGDSFGRLLERGMPSVDAKPVEVVKEAPPITDQDSPDPMLVAPAAREQYLYDHSSTSSTATTSASIEPMTHSPRVGEAKISIVGGPEGVSVSTQPRRRQTLRGGFGR